MYLGPRYPNCARDLAPYRLSSVWFLHLTIWVPSHSFHVCMFASVHVPSQSATDRRFAKLYSRILQVMPCVLWPNMFSWLRQNTSESVRNTQCAQFSCKSDNWRSYFDSWLKNTYIIWKSWNIFSCSCDFDQFWSESTDSAACCGSFRRTIVSPGMRAGFASTEGLQVPGTCRTCPLNFGS